MDDTKQLITETALELLGSMGFEADIKIIEIDNRLWVHIETTEPQLLIGRAGENISPIKHVLKLIIKKRIQDVPAPFELDVNNYRQQKISLLREVARSLAERVTSSGQELLLKPMPAFERRIVHLELGSRSGVVTESVGEEPERRIVIRPAAFV